MGLSLFPLQPATVSGGPPGALPGGPLEARTGLYPHRFDVERIRRYILRYQGGLWVAFRFGLGRLSLAGNAALPERPKKRFVLILPLTLDKMLPLDDPRWATVSSCYGERSVATLLQKLLTVPLPLPHREHEPTLWDELFGELYHQGTLYPATIAAMPHLVRLVARVEPPGRAEWLSGIAEIEAMRTLGDVYDPEGQITPELMTAYEQALRDVVPLVQEAIEAGARWEGVKSEVTLATLLSLLAFAQRERRLGFLLARWWPYSQTRTEQRFIPVAGLEQYEELTGDVQDPLK